MKNFTKRNLFKKLSLSRIFVTLAMALFFGLSTSAHDFEVSGKYYNIISKADKTVEITFQGWYYNTIEEYFGDITIPAYVVYQFEKYSVISIGENAFHGCTGLTSVDIPGTVTSIGASAFYECSGLTSVEIPSTVTSIGASAFSGCSSLTSIEIPNSVTEIGDFAFINCESLTSVTIPNSVTSIGTFTFSGCSNLSDIEIPNSVTSIGNIAFSGCGFTNIKIPHSVTTIGASAFTNCPNLTSVEIPNSVTSVGNGAFSYCENLTSVVWDVKHGADYEGTKAPFHDSENIKSFVFGNSVEYIPARILNEVDALMNIDMSNSVTEIGEYAFIGCRAVSINISNSVTSIGSGAFNSCHELTNIEIPNSVTEIGKEAFFWCSRLKSVKLSNSLTSTQYRMFGFCESLTSIEIPNSVKSIANAAFIGCNGLTSVEIPNSITSIGDSAFSGCSSLTSIEIPNSVTKIGEAAFYNCDGLTSVNIPNSVTKIEDSTFDSCDSLTSVNIPNSVTSIGENAFYNCDGLTSVTIGNSVTSIGKNAFYDCSGLTSVEIPNSVKSIGEDAFSSCIKVIWLTETPPSGYASVGGKIHYVLNESYSNLENVRVYPYLNLMFENEGVKYVPLNPSDRICDVIDFKYDTSREDVYIGRSISNKGVDLTVGTIMPYAFYKHDYIKTIEVHNAGILGYNSFYGCSGLNKAIISNQSIIGEGAFIDCFLNDNNGENTLIIGDEVYTINQNAFSGCTNLNSVTLGSNIELIGDEVFNDCVNLTELISYSINPPECLTQSLYDIDKWNCTLKVPKEAVSAYQSAEQWKDFFFIEALPAEDVIAESIVFNKSKLTLEVGTTKTLNVSILPENTTNKTVSWKSSDESVATVDENGKVTAIAVGEAEITATTTDGSNLSATCNVTVEPEFIFATSISLDQTKLALNIGETQILTATVLPESATNKTVEWTTSNARVAEVSEDGEVTVNMRGKATITATTTDGTNLSASCELTATSGIEEIENQDLLIKVDGNNIFVCDAQIGETLRVFATDGSLVASNEVTDSTTVVSVPVSGLYLVKVGNQTAKVLVK